MDLHGSSRGARRALAKAGRSAGELVVGVGQVRPPQEPAGTPIIGALDTAFYYGGTGVDYSLSALEVPPIVGTYPPAENTDTFATQTYDAVGQPPGVPGWTGPGAYSAHTVDGRAILREPPTGRVRLQARVPVKCDPFGGISDAGHRLFFTATLNGNTFDGYSDSAFATRTGTSGNWVWVFDQVIDDTIAQELFDASKDGTGFPFSITVYFWPNQVATNVREVFPQRAIARPLWNVGPSPQLGIAGNYLRLQYELDVYPELSGAPLLIGGATAFEGHSRGHKAMP